MAAYNPPTEQLPIFDNSVFNSINGDTVLTVSIANLLYLRKTFPDIATAIETFSAGIITDDIDSNTDLTLGKTNASEIFLGGALHDIAVTVFGPIDIYSSELVVGTSGGKKYVQIDQCWFTNGIGSEATIDTPTAKPLFIAPPISIEPNAVCTGVTIGNTTIPVSINSSTLNIATENSINTSCNILTGQNCTGTINIGTANVGTNAVPINIGSGNSTGYLTLGNSANRTDINSSYVTIGNNPSIINSIYIGNGNDATNDIRIVDGTGLPTASTVKISTGTTTGALTLGNTLNTVQINGGLSIGTGKNITLQPNATYVEPTANTMLGGITTGTVLSITFPFTVGTNIGTLSVEKGTYLIFINIEAQFTGSFSTNFLNFHTSGTAVPRPSTFECGASQLIIAGKISFLASIGASFTTAGTLILRYNNTGGSVSALNNFNYYAIRIA